MIGVEIAWTDAVDMFASRLCRLRVVKRSVEAVSWAKALATRTPVLSDVSIGHGVVIPPPDVTPPVISSVTANATSSYTSSAAVVTWHTDEASTSEVTYGTTAGALTGSATGAAGVVAHVASITGLAPNKTYYYRVTSRDPSGNVSTSPAPDAAAMRMRSIMKLSFAFLAPAASASRTFASASL